MNGNEEHDAAVGAELDFLIYFCDGCGHDVSIIECPHVPDVV